MVNLDAIHLKRKQSSWMRFENMLPLPHSRSIIGDLHWQSKATQGFGISFQPPSWLSQLLFSITVHKSTMGWQVNLRTHEIVYNFSWDLRQAIESDNPANVYRHLDEHKMSPFVINASTENLLHVCPHKAFLSSRRFNR